MISAISFQWFHWFDLLIIVVIGVGVYRNRHSNALHQIFGFIHWLFILGVSAFLCEKPAQWIAELVGMRPDVAALILYPVIVSIVYFISGIKKRSLVQQSDKVEMFGRQEYRVAMVFGGIKSVVILMVVMAWIHGRYVTEADLHAYEVFCQENLGGIRLPIPATVQEDIFVDSFSGKAAQKYLSKILLKALPPLPEQEKELLAKKGEGKSVKINPKLKKGADTAEGIVNELENDKGKKKWGEKEGEGTAANATTESGSASGQSGKNLEIIYKQLSLKGISGVGAKRMALINNQTLRQGESEMVKVENRKVKVFCQEIRDTSVVILVDDKKEPIELILNAK